MCYTGTCVNEGLDGRPIGICVEEDCPLAKRYSHIYRCEECGEFYEFSDKEESKAKDFVCKVCGLKELKWYDYKEE